MAEKSNSSKREKSNRPIVGGNSAVFQLSKSQFDDDNNSVESLPELPPENILPKTPVLRYPTTISPSLSDKRPKSLLKPFIAMPEIKSLPEAVKSKLIEEQPKRPPEVKEKIPCCLPHLEGSKDRKRLLLKQPFKTLFDIWGVMTPIGFRQQLYSYVFENMEEYLVSHYNTPSIEAYVERITKRNHVERSRESGLPEISVPQPGEDPKNPAVQRRICQTIRDNLIARRNHKNKNTLLLCLDDLFNEIWFEAYRNGKLEVPIFEDIIRNLATWQAAPFFIKHYTFASGPEENQRLFLKASRDGDKLNDLVTSTFDTHRRYKYEVERYGTVVRCLGEREPSNLFYFTDSPTKARLAARKGITAFVVLRPGNKIYKPELLEAFRVIESLDDLEFVPADAVPCC